MNELARILEPKSDQLNAEDLVLGDKTIVVTDVILNANASERKITIRFDGDNGKPWFPCKTVGRTLAHAYGPDTKQWIGKTIVLFRNPDVVYAGKKEGGIRIRAMSGIRPELLEQNGVMKIAVAEMRGARKQLAIGCIPDASSQNDFSAILPDGEEAASHSEEFYRNWFLSVSKDARKWLTDQGHHDRMKAMIAEQAEAIAHPQPEGRTDEQHGDQHDDADHDDMPVYQGMVDNWKARIEGAAGPNAIIGVRQELHDARKGLPDDVVADLDKALDEGAAKFTTGEL